MSLSVKAPYTLYLSDTIHDAMCFNISIQDTLQNGEVYFQSKTVNKEVPVILTGVLW